MISLPSQPGSYALELALAEPLRLQIGRLGEYLFPAGRYIYLGSASGPGGLRARLGRHLDPPLSRPHRWHIDYLRFHAAPLAACSLTGGPITSGVRLECCWSSFFFNLPGSFLPAPGFGASDCTAGCPAHLIGFQVMTGAPILQNLALRLSLARLGGMQVERLAFYLTAPGVK